MNETRRVPMYLEREQVFYLAACLLMEFRSVLVCSLFR